MSAPGKRSVHRSIWQLGFPLSFFGNRSHDRCILINVALCWGILVCFLFSNKSWHTWCMLMCRAVISRWAACLIVGCCWLMWLNNSTRDRSRKLPDIIIERWFLHWSFSFFVKWNVCKHRRLELNYSPHCKHLGILMKSLILSVSTSSTLMYSKSSFGSACKYTYYRLLLLPGDWSVCCTSFFSLVICFFKKKHRLVLLFLGRREPSSTSRLPAACTLFLFLLSILPPR